jgi:hypothetical protein
LRLWFAYSSISTKSCFSILFNYNEIYNNVLKLALTTFLSDFNVAIYIIFQNNVRNFCVFVMCFFLYFAQKAVSPKKPKNKMIYERNCSECKKYRNKQKKKYKNVIDALNLKIKFIANSVRGKIWFALFCVK